MDETFEYDIFLSFSSEDYESAKKIFTQLASHGVKVFFSHETLKPDAGLDFHFRIETGLERSQHFLLTATHNAFRSPWVEVEYVTFFDLFYVPDRKRRRFFIALPDQGFDRRELPPFLRPLQIPESIEAIARIVQSMLSEARTPLSEPTAASPKPSAEVSHLQVLFAEDIGRFEENLLSVYGSHRVKSVDDEGLLRRYLGDDVDVMLKDSRLLRTVETVRNLKLALEGLDHHSDQGSVLPGIVRLLKWTQGSDPLKGRFLYELIRKTYHPIWNQRQIDGFEKTAAVLLTWRDVYVSYTNRDASHVNSEYRRAIRAVLGSDGLHDEEGGQNLVARAVIRLLLRHNLTINDKYHEIMDRQDIGAVMESQVKNSFFLIQLLDGASFVANARQRNWMFDEYRNFRSAVAAGGEEISNERFLPVVLGRDVEAVLPAFVPLEYESWCDHIRSVDYLSLPTGDADALPSRISQIAKHVARKKEEMVESMAQNWLLP